MVVAYSFFFFFFQAEDGIRDYKVTGVQTCALPISMLLNDEELAGRRPPPPRRGLRRLLEAPLGPVPLEREVRHRRQGLLRISVAHASSPPGIIASESPGPPGGRCHGVQEWVSGPSPRTSRSSGTAPGRSCAARASSPSPRPCSSRASATSAAIQGRPSLICWTSWPTPTRRCSRRWGSTSSSRGAVLRAIGAGPGAGLLWDPHPRLPHARPRPLRRRRPPPDQYAGARGGAVLQPRPDQPAALHVRHGGPEVREAPAGRPALDRRA